MPPGADSFLLQPPRIKSKASASAPAALPWELSPLLIGICFGFRISDFGFCPPFLPDRRCPAEENLGEDQVKGREGDVRGPSRGSATISLSRGAFCDYSPGVELMRPDIILWVYIVLLVVGGLIGFLKAGSKISLIMSVVFAALLSLCAARVVFQPYMADILFAALLVVFGYRLTKT